MNSMRAVLARAGLTGLTFPSFYRLGPLVNERLTARSLADYSSLLILLVSVPIPKRRETSLGTLNLLRYHPAHEVDARDLRMHKQCRKPLRAEIRLQPASASAPPQSLLHQPPISLPIHHSMSNMLAIFKPLQADLPSFSPGITRAGLDRRGGTD